MEQLSRSLPLIKFERNLPEKVIMFGEGAFLRAFACFALEELNKKGLFGGSVTVVQAVEDGEIGFFKKQDGLFTVVERGEVFTQPKLITCVADCINPYDEYEHYINRSRNPDLRYVISDTTEAGISYRVGDNLADRPQRSFPGKITAFLHERFTFFKGDRQKGLVFLPCESGGENGAKLKDIVQRYAEEWELSGEFKQWVDGSCFFFNTLADRLVEGYPYADADKIFNELRYRDDILSVCEPFFFWAIEAPLELRRELPFDKTGLNIIYSDNIAPFRLRKERMLDGVQASVAPAALLYGLKTMKEVMADDCMKSFVHNLLYNEIAPTFDMNKNVVTGYARSVTERLSNPYIRRDLIKVADYNLSKYTTRILPIIREYRRRFDALPPVLTFSVAALIAFYKNGGRFNITDDEKSIAFLADNKIDVILKNTGVWGADLTENRRFCAEVEKLFGIIKQHGVKPLIERLIKL